MNWKLFCCILLIICYSCKSKSTTTGTEKQQKTGGAGGRQGGNKGPVKVDAVIVQTSTLNESIEVPGTLLPFEVTEVHPEVAGRVVSLNIHEGATVGKGTVIAKLFDADLQAQLKKLNVQLQTAAKTEERQRQLLKIGGISQQDFDLSLLNVSSIRADMAVLQANISKTIVRAPFSGKIGFINITNGSYVTPQTVITTIRQVNQLKLEFSVPEKYYSKVALGKFISFSVEGVPKRYAAKIIATESGISEDNRSLKVRALVQAVDNYLSAGAFAKVKFDMGDNNQAIMVPSESIIPTARDKKVIVYRSGTATFQTVKTGTRDSSRVQILEGLAVGDTIITTGILQVKPNSKIQLTSVKR